MHEAVGDGGCGRGIVKEGAPVLEGQIRRDDGRAALVTLVEDLVEKVGSASVEAEISQFVNDEQSGCSPGQ